MSTNNEKLGLKRAGKRPMMKLPADRALRNTLTSAQCPTCQSRAARLSALHPGAFWCTVCGHTWEVVR